MEEKKATRQHILGNRPFNGNNKHQGLYTASLRKRSGEWLFFFSIFLTIVCVALLYTFFNVEWPIGNVMMRSGFFFFHRGPLFNTSSLDLFHALQHSREWKNYRLGVTPRPKTLTATHTRTTNVKITKRNQLYDLILVVSLKPFAEK